MDLALNNLERLICRKTQNNQPTNQEKGIQNTGNIVGEETF